MSSFFSFSSRSKSGGNAPVEHIGSDVGAAAASASSSASPVSARSQSISLPSSDYTLSPVPMPSMLSPVSPTSPLSPTSRPPVPPRPRFRSQSTVLTQPLTADKTTTSQSLLLSIPDATTTNIISRTRSVSELPIPTPSSASSSESDPSPVFTLVNVVAPPPPLTREQTLELIYSSVSTFLNLQQEHEKLSHQQGDRIKFTYHPDQKGFDKATRLFVLQGTKAHWTLVVERTEERASKVDGGKTHQSIEVPGSFVTHINSIAGPWSIALTSSGDAAVPSDLIAPPKPENRLFVAMCDFQDKLLPFFDHQVLTFNQGDRFHLKRHEGTEWMLVASEKDPAQQGWVPSNFVKEFETEASPSASKASEYADSPDPPSWSTKTSISLRLFDFGGNMCATKPGSPDTGKDSGVNTAQYLQSCAMTHFNKYVQQADGVANNAFAQCMVAFAYRTGSWVAYDARRAVEYYYKAAMNGNAEAQYQLAIMCDKGEGTHRNAEHAHRWLVMAAQNGHADAGDLLPFYSSFHDAAKLNPFVHDYDLFEHFQCAPTCYPLSRFENDHAYLCGEWRFPLTAPSKVRRNIPIDQLLSVAANRGDAEAQRILASCHLNGGSSKLFPVDQALAVSWLQKAVGQGHRYAAAQLQSLIRRGKIVVANLENMDEVQLASVANKIPAVGRTFKQHLLAAEGRCAWSQAFIGWAYESGHWVVRDEKAAVEWYRKAVASDNGCGEAQFRLACCYEAGVGIEKDEKQAMELFRQAFKNGKFEAADHIEDLKEQAAAAAAPSAETISSPPAFEESVQSPTGVIDPPNLHQETPAAETSSQPQATSLERLQVLEKEWNAKLDCLSPGAPLDSRRLAQEGEYNQQIAQCRAELLSEFGQEGRQENETSASTATTQQVDAQLTPQPQETTDPSKPNEQVKSINHDIVKLQEEMEQALSEGAVEQLEAALLKLQSLSMAAEHQTTDQQLPPPEQQAHHPKPKAEVEVAAAAASNAHMKVAEFVATCKALTETSQALKNQADQLQNQLQQSATKLAEEVVKNASLEARVALLERKQAEDREMMRTLSEALRIRS